VVTRLLTETLPWWWGTFVSPWPSIVCRVPLLLLCYSSSRTFCSWKSFECSFVFWQIKLKNVQGQSQNQVSHEKTDSVVISSFLLVSCLLNWLRLAVIIALELFVELKWLWRATYKRNWGKHFILRRMKYCLKKNLFNFCDSVKMQNLNSFGHEMQS